MPGTFTFNEVVIAASDCVQTGITEARNSMACNMALYKIWEAFDWRDTLADFPPFYLIGLVQDYGAPQVAVPSDFLGLRRAYFVNLSAQGDVPFVKPITCPGDLELTDITGTPESICWRPAAQKFRVHPLPPASYKSPWYIIEGQYKRKPYVVTAAAPTTPIFKMTAQSLESALIPFSDAYLTMWVEAVKWALMTIADDPKAGQAQTQNGVTGYSGQLGKMMAEMQLMADREAGELAAPPSHPRDVLMEQGWWW
jgi:hypothetical protein